MSIFNELLAAPQYSVPFDIKNALLYEELQSLTQFHREHCAPYRNIVTSNFFTAGGDTQNQLESIPFLPVRLFKSMLLQSVEDKDVVKILTSSGTTSSVASRIAIDKTTSLLQTKALVSIVSSFIGTQRLPMIIVDTQAVLRNRDQMSARGAGLVGLSNFGRDHFYALDEEMHLDLDALLQFAERWGSQPVLLFGFTYMVWQYLFAELRRRNIKLNLSKAFLIHSGGWKKLQEQAVSNQIFKETAFEQCGIEHVHNFYGMVEQVGSVYMECEKGYFHAPNYADIKVRSHVDWSLLPLTEQGIIHTFSILPRSYPGHSLLTEDIGRIHGIDDCACGRKGAYFSIEGRIPKAELRGCSDTHAASVMMKAGRE